MVLISAGPRVGTVQREARVWGQLGITWTEAAIVVASTVTIYLTFIVFVRVVGQRSLASMAGFDFGCAVALGSVRLRLAGIRNLDEVQCVILERNGHVSVIKQGAITGDLVADVAGHEMLITS
jgi:uncharacterized membrane protein YcaP (DUF421 family)